MHKRPTYLKALASPPRQEVAWRAFLLGFVVGALVGAGVFVWL